MGFTAFEDMIASAEQLLNGNAISLAANEDGYTVTTPRLEPTNGC